MMQDQDIMLNFTVGPVMSSEGVRAIGSEQVPYFRTPEFSQVMFENEALIKKFAKADKDARVVFITGSGSAAMEATLINTFTPQDKVLVINGGSFGERFVQLCKVHHIPYTELVPEFGYDITDEMLAPYEQQGYTGFLVNVNETSTGVHYNIERISAFCKRNNLFLVVDAISSFLADAFDMEALGADVMITGSQKALACPPGISIITLSSRGVERVYQHDAGCMYFDLKDALKNGERGQTPFTPADFVSHSPGNAVTPLHPRNVSAYDVFTTLKDEYHIWICPNGGDMRDRIFRVGHIGALTIEDNTRLLEALKDMQKHGLL